MEMTVVPQEAFYLGTLGGGVLHNQPPDHLDNLVDHVYHQNQCQHRQHAGKGDGVTGQHAVGEVTHRQGGDLTENSGKSQNQQNQQKVRLLPGGRMESSFFKRVCCFIVNPILSGACPETSKRKKTSGQSNLCPDDGVDNGTRTHDLQSHNLTP